METTLLPPRMALPALLLLLLVMFSCEDDNDTTPEEQPTCRIQSFFFTLPNGTVDSNVYTFGADGRIATFQRMARAVNKTITPGI